MTGKNPSSELDSLRGNPALLFCVLVSGAVCLLFTLASFENWSGFRYTTFDLAFYVQALWGALHGHWNLSLLDVPMLGNHADLIVFLLVPVYALLPHPFFPVLVQNAALACMAPAGFRFARDLGFSRWESCGAGLLLLLAPATGFAAMHEFHPETLAAPFLLCMALARRTGNFPMFWLWFVAALACKENIALLLGWWFAVEAVLDRGRGWQWRKRWCLIPMLAAWGWLLLYLKLLAPLWNGGNVDFGALYARLGDSLPAVALSPVLRPDAFFETLSQSLRGNLLPGLLLPFLLLPLLRPRWLLITAPLLAQHLLSFRSSEWTIYFHYAAPLVPLLWIGSMQALTRGRRVLVPALVCACLGCSFYFGLAQRIAKSLAQDPEVEGGVQLRRMLLERIPHDASVTAGLSFQAHLAERAQLYSLHHLLKGLNTLGTSRYVPPAAVDAVLVDFSDGATFDAGAGFYHPTMRTRTGEIIPSSDMLAHAFLRRHHWRTISEGPATLYLREQIEPEPVAPIDPMPEPRWFDPATELVGIQLHTVEASGALQIRTDWRIHSERNALPWMRLVLLDENGTVLGILQRGWCVPEASASEKLWRDEWTVVVPDLPGMHALRIECIDQARLLEGRLSGSMQTYTPEITFLIPLVTP